MRHGALQAKLIWTSDTWINFATHRNILFCEEVLLGWYCSIVQHDFSENMPCKINYWRKTAQHFSWHPVVLTSTIKSTSSVALFTFALEGALGVEALCMEVTPVCICHTFIYIWEKIERIQWKLCWNPRLLTACLCHPSLSRHCKH